MNTGKKITIFMINGNHFGPRTAEIGNWTGKAIYSPRRNIEDLVTRDDMQRPAVYILKSDPTNEFYTEQVYIGQCSNLRERLAEHVRNDKNGFTEFLAFISKDDLLTPSQTMFLESKVIALAKEAKTSEVSNKVTPKLPLLSEPDQADMEYFLEQSKLILTLMGFHLLNRSVKPKQTVIAENADIKEVLYFDIKSTNFKATMFEGEEGYVVLTGSQCNIEAADSLSAGWRKLRESLIAKSLIVKKDGLYEFMEDVIFSSPSAAASVILGKQAPGPIVWIEKKSGKTYKEISELSS